jgi:hypothetical protein
VKPEVEFRLEDEWRQRRGSLKEPADLLKRAIGSDEFLDHAILGGISIADVATGKVGVADSQPVLDAFRQHPQYGSSFVEAVRNLSVHPDELAGLVRGRRQAFRN